MLRGRFWGVRAGDAPETSFWMKRCWLRKARRILTATPSLRAKTSSLTFFCDDPMRLLQLQVKPSGPSFFAISRGDDSNFGKNASRSGNTSNRTLHDVRLKTGSRVSRAAEVPSSTCAGGAAESETRVAWV